MTQLAPSQQTKWAFVEKVSAASAIEPLGNCRGGTAPNHPHPTGKDVPADCQPLKDTTMTKRNSAFRRAKTREKFMLMSHREFISIAIEGPPGLGKTFTAGEILNQGKNRLRPVAAHAPNLLDVLYETRNDRYTLLWDDTNPPVFNNDFIAGDLTSG